MSARNFSLIVCLVLLSATTTMAQRVAIVTPDKTDRDLAYATDLVGRLQTPIKVPDTSMADAAFRSVTITNPFNMTVNEAKAAAAVMGCEFFVLARVGAQRRTSFSRPEYYEAFAVVYLVSGRTGEVLLWKLKSFDGDDQLKANRALSMSIAATAVEVSDVVKASRPTYVAKPLIAAIEEVPEESTAAALNLKPPIPYRRIKPEYTSQAYLYDVRATVELEADIGADGQILATRIVRWAGFGLEESVEKAVRTMNWRPAMRKGKPLPMRVLLRYNFTKVEKDS